MDMVLNDYLGAFSAAKTTAASQSGMVKKKVLELQQILNGLHHQTLKSDGLWGPGTAGAWSKVATSKGLNPGIDRAGPNDAWVVPATYNALALRPEPKTEPKPVAPKPMNGRMVPFVIMPKAKPAGEEKPRTFVKAKPTKPSQAGLIKVRVDNVQQGLNAYRTDPVLLKAWELANKGVAWPKLVDDGLFGPKTVDTWKRFGKAVNLENKSNFNWVIDRAGPNEVWVHPDTFARFESDQPDTSKVIVRPSPAPGPAPTTLVQKPVIELQTLLHGLGWSKKDIVPDGLFGPKTKTAWAAAAKKRGLPQTFKRVNANTAAVAPETLSRFEKAIAGKKPLIPKPAPAPAPAPGTVVKTVAELQALLFGVGWTTKKLKADGLFGPQTKKAWGISAGLRKLPKTFERVNGKNARVNKNTYRKIKADAQAAKTAPTPEPAPSPKPAPAPTPAPAPQPEAEPKLVDKSVAELQQLLYGVGWTKKKLTADGLFGPQTKKAWGVSAKLRKLPGTFTRVDSRTAQVARSTYRKIKQDAAKAAPAPTPGPTPAPTPGPMPAPAPAPGPEPTAGMVEKGVEHLQKILRALGWRPRTVVIDGLYGPKTASSWASSAKTRGLDGRMERVTKNRVLVVKSTYQRLLADSRKAPEPAPGPQPLPEPSTAVLTVKTVQQGLNGKGVKPMLDTDGLWGTRSKNAFEGWLKVQPGGATAKYRIDTKKKLVTMPKAFGEVLAAAAKNAPAPPPRVSISVAEVKRGLGMGPYQVGPGAGLDATTRASLERFIKDTDFGVNTGFKVSKDARTVLRIRKNVADKLKALAAGKPVPTPTPKPAPAPTPGPAPVDPLEAKIRALLKLLTEPVEVILVQKALKATGNFPEVPLSGVWDDPTQGALVSLFPESTHPMWIGALPRTLSPDGRVVKLTPALAEKIRQAAASYKPKPAPAPAPQPGPSPAPAPAPRPGPSPAPAPEPYPEPEPSPGPEPTPVPGPVDPSRGIAAWENLVDGLTVLFEQGPELDAAVTEATKTGERLSTEAAETYRAWVTAANNLKRRAASIIESSPQLMAALDAAGPSVGFAGAVVAPAGYQELAGWFGNLGSAATRAAEILREPIRPAPGLGGLGVWPTIARQVFSKLLTLMRTRTASTAAGTAIVMMGADDVINGDTKEFLDHNAKLADLVAQGKLTTEQAGKLKEKPPGGIGGALVAGAVALGGLALVLARRK